MNIDIEPYLKDIKSLTFSKMSLRCTIELEDGSSLVYDNKNNTTNETSNKISSYNGAMDKVKKLCGERVNQSKPTIEIMDMTDVLYHFIGASTFTVGDLNNRLNVCAHNSHYTIIQTCKSSLPIVCAGRRTGHTTAIRRFIADNRHMTFGIMVDEESYIRDYRDYKNAYSIRTGDVPAGFMETKLRGVKLDYIIIDKYISAGLDTYALKRVLCTSTTNHTKLVALGN